MSKQFWHISPFIFQVAVTICRAVSFPPYAVVLLLRYLKVFHCWFERNLCKQKSHFIVVYKIVLYSHNIQGHQYFSINIVHSVLQPHFMHPRSNLVFAKKEQAHPSKCLLFSRLQPGFKGFKYLFLGWWGSILNWNVIIVRCYDVFFDLIMSSRHLESCQVSHRWLANVALSCGPQNYTVSEEANFNGLARFTLRGRWPCFLRAYWC